MKICVYFQPTIENDNFEGMRLRKNIKGALELHNIPYAKNLLDTYDIVHFMSLDDEAKIIDAKEANIPIVFSALYCENDNAARILQDKNGIKTLSPKALKILNKCDAVLVSDEFSRSLLQRDGVKVDVEIVSPGVNLSRFIFNSEIEEDIVYNYFQIEKEQKIIATVGSYDKPKTIKQIIKIASLCPKYRFLYFGKAKLSRLIKTFKKIPSNLKLCPIMSDEIYCSMMKQSSIYLSLDNSSHSPIGLLDAAASKSQVIALSPTNENEEILNNVRAYVCEDEKDVANTITNLLENKIESHVDEAYEFAKNNSLKNLGEHLIEIYSRLI